MSDVTWDSTFETYRREASVNGKGTVAAYYHIDLKDADGKKVKDDWVYRDVSDDKRTDVWKTVYGSKPATRPKPTTSRDTPVPSGFRLVQSTPSPTEVEGAEKGNPMADQPQPPSHRERPEQIDLTPTGTAGLVSPDFMTEQVFPPLRAGPRAAKKKRTESMTRWWEKMKLWWGNWNITQKQVGWTIASILAIVVMVALGFGGQQLYANLSKNIEVATPSPPASTGSGSSTGVDVNGVAIAITPLENRVNEAIKLLGQLVDAQNRTSSAQAKAGADITDLKQRLEATNNAVRLLPQLPKENSPKPDWDAFAKKLEQRLLPVPKIDPELTKPAVPIVPIKPTS